MTREIFMCAVFGGITLAGLITLMSAQWAKSKATNEALLFIGGGIAILGFVLFMMVSLPAYALTLPSAAVKEAGR